VPSAGVQPVAQLEMLDFLQRHVNAGTGMHHRCPATGALPAGDHPLGAQPAGLGAACRATAPRCRAAGAGRPPAPGLLGFCRGIGTPVVLVLQRRLERWFRPCRPGAAGPGLPAWQAQVLPRRFAFMAFAGHHHCRTRPRALSYPLSVRVGQAQQRIFRASARARMAV
jgi:hypothetical protein